MLDGKNKDLIFVVSVALIENIPCTVFFFFTVVTIIHMTWHLCSFVYFYFLWW